MVKNLPAMQETWVRSPGREDPLKKGMATHSSILIWRSPWTQEPGRLQSMGSQRVGHDWATNPFTFTFQQSDRAQVTCKLLPAVTERSTNGKSNLELFPGFLPLLLLFACSLFIPCSLLRRAPKNACWDICLNPFGGLHLLSPHSTNHRQTCEVFLFSKDLNCENLLLHPAYSGYQGE